MRTLHYHIETPVARIEHLLKATYGYSASLIRRLKLEDAVFLNGSPIRMVDGAFVGDCLTILLKEDPTHLVPNPTLSVTVVYQDEDVVVYDKPALMPMHPSILHRDDTLANAHTARFDGGFHALNRLDSNTTGLCVVARHAYAAARLAHQVGKEYTALVGGRLPLPKGTIHAPIARVTESIIERQVAITGQRAVTHYEVVDQNDHYSLVKVQLETGRTHQIRVHFSFLGFPLAGDSLYGGDCSDYPTHMLCCSAVAFPHPITGERLSFQTTLQHTPFMQSE